MCVQYIKPEWCQLKYPLVDKVDFVHIKKLMFKIEIKSTPLPPALALFGQAGWQGSHKLQNFGSF